MTLKSFALILCCGLLLASCEKLNALRATSSNIDNEFVTTAKGIHVSAAMKKSRDWTHYFKALYPAMMHCLKAHPAQPAWATRVTPLRGGKAEIRMQGANGRILDCKIDQKGTSPESLTDAYALDFEQPAFFPIAHGKPQAHECLAFEEVEKGWLYETIGWIAHHTCTPPWQAGEDHLIYDLDREEGPVIEQVLPGLPEEGVKILAYVTSRINTSCDRGQCALTTALGLGKQCGDRHVEAISQGFGGFDSSQCVYNPDGATKIIWADDLILKRLAKDEWEVSGNITRADDRGHTKLPLKETYRVGDTGEIVMESSTMDDWQKF